MIEVSSTSPATLTKALLRAAEQLGLTADLSVLLGVDAAEVANLQTGDRVLDPQKKEWERALKIVSLFRSLISLLGTPERARVWLGASHDTFGAAPIELLRAHDERVYRYLNAVHKHELRLPPRTRRDN